MKSHALPYTQRQNYVLALLIGAVFMFISFIPLSAQAATSKPSCALTVSVGSEDARITKKGDVIVPKDGSFTIKWSSKNAEDAELDDEEIELSDSDTFSPKKTTTYEFTFKSGSKKATCKVTAHVADGSIDEVTSGKQPTLSGEATGAKKVGVAIYKEGVAKAVFKKNVPVKRGAWEVKVTKKLAEGEYEVRLTGDRKYELNQLATATLTIEDDENELSGGDGSKGTLSVTTLPLLAGGTTRASGNVPIVYLQLKNTGSEAVHVTGFKVKQNGNASASGIMSLSTVDDKGGSRGASGTHPFKDNIAFAPTDATIEPGALKLFTIKAQLGTNVSVGTNLKLDIIGVESNGTEKGTFPLRGVTWAIGS